jgi:hypothetical protein
MTQSLVKEFVKETVVCLGPSTRQKLPFPLEGVVRLVDRKGHLLGMVCDKKVWEELSEWLEYADPAFWNELDASRKSGRVSSKTIERRLGMA